MSTVSSCPPAERLRQLLTGAAPADEQAQLVAHLDDYAACQRLLDELAGADPALLGMAGTLQRTAIIEEASLRRVLDDLRTDSGLSVLRPSHQRGAWLQALLQPVNYLEALGRLEDYDITELLGQGGMGIVLKAFEPALNRWVAIKVLAPDLVGDELARRRFAREAQAAAAVRHENVIIIHAVREANGIPFIVMEYVAGGSLQDYLDRKEAPDWKTAARLGAEIAAGLAAAHARGLVHRDIKPSNILLAGEPGRVSAGSTVGKAPGANATGLACNATGLAGLVAKIGDFGLARVADEARLTQTDMVPGTPMYMAPEQALCETLDHRADLFSLGSVMYALCTSREPFSAGTAVAVLKHVCETTPRPIREFNRAVPAWLVATIERLQAKRPADRFVTAAEVAELLRYNLNHLDQPRYVPAPARHWLDRKKRGFLVATVAAAVLLAGGLTLSESRGWTHLTRSHASRGEQDNPLPLRAELRGHGGPVFSLAYSPNGNTIATGSDDTTLRFWDAATGQQQAELSGHSGAVRAVAFAHSGKFLVSGGSDGNLRIWDVASPKQQQPLPHAGASIPRFAIAPDDSTLAVANNAQDVELWDLGTGKTRRTLAVHDGTIYAIAFSPDGNTLAAGDANGRIRLWDPVTGTERATFQGDPFGLRVLAFAPDSQTLASAGTGAKEVRLWEVADQQRIGAVPGPESGIMSMAYSPDGRMLAVGSRDGTVQLYDVSSLRPLAHFHAHQSNVWSLAFSPDGRTLATAGEDHLGKLWDIAGKL